MPLTLSDVDYFPLYSETELKIDDEAKLAEHVAYLMLGNHLHVKSILDVKNHSSPTSPKKIIDMAIAKLIVSTDVQRYKRDGWIYQMINWIAIYKENSGARFFAQIPHDAPAQHGLDGIAILLKNDGNLQQVIISEDKYTENPKKVLRAKVWPEFADFEQGVHDNKLVSRISSLISHLDHEQLMTSINDDIFRPEIRKYRAAITPDSDLKKDKNRPELFKGYDVCVKGADHSRRNTLTFYTDDIRTWMDTFCVKISNFLESL